MAGSPPLTSSHPSHSVRGQRVTEMATVSAAFTEIQLHAAKGLEPKNFHSLQWTFNKVVLLCMHLCSHGKEHVILTGHINCASIVMSTSIQKYQNPGLVWRQILAYALFLFSLRKLYSLNKLSNCLGLFLLESALEPHFPDLKYWVAGQKPTHFSATPGGVLPYIFILQ